MFSGLRLISWRRKIHEKRVAKIKVWIIFYRKKPIFFCILLYSVTINRNKNNQIPVHKSNCTNLSQKVVDLHGSCVSLDTQCHQILIEDDNLDIHIWHCSVGRIRFREKILDQLGFTWRSAMILNSINMWRKIIPY